MRYANALAFVCLISLVACSNENKVQGTLALQPQFEGRAVSDRWTGVFRAANARREESFVQLNFLQGGRVEMTAQDDHYPDLTWMAVTDTQSYNAKVLAASCNAVSFYQAEVGTVLYVHKRGQEPLSVQDTVASGLVDFQTSRLLSTQVPPSLLECGPKATLFERKILPGGTLAISVTEAGKEYLFLPYESDQWIGETTPAPEKERQEYRDTW